MMKVVKRDGRQEAVHFEKITHRLRKLCSLEPRASAADVSRVAQHACAAVHDLIKTETLDHITADAAVALATEHPDYSVLAARILVSNLQKTTHDDVAQVYSAIRHVVSEDFMNIILAHAEEFNAILDYSRDYKFDYFGFKTLQKAYLLSGERPQHMYLRVAVGLWGSDLERVRETYEALSTHLFTHASPTLFNSGTKTPQLASCFLMGVHTDSLDAIFESFHKAATISKYGGGIGFHVSSVRGKGSLIKSTNGTSDGLVPMLKVANEVFKYVNQCFVPETPVYTRESGVQRMDEVAVGDHLVTRDGSFKRVNEVFMRAVESEPMVTLTPKFGFEGITCTKVHEIFALRRQAPLLNYDVIRNRLDKGLAAPEFCPAGDLVVGDFVGFPIPRDTVDYEDFSEDLCRLYGIMLGDGSISKKGKTVRIALNLTSKQHTVAFVECMLQTHSIRYTTSFYNNCYSICVAKGQWTLGIDSDMLYDSDDEKRVDPRFLNLPKPKTLALLRGLLESDGSVLGEIYFSTTSRPLVLAVRYLCLRLGVLTSAHAKHTSVGETHQIRPGEFITARKLPYAVRIPKHPALSGAAEFTPYTKFAFFEYDGILYTRLINIEHSVYSGDVYDFNMESNHNYTTDAGLVHNSGKRKGSCAIYIEPHHSDILQVLDLKRNQGDEHLRARDLFYALWISDVFMERVEADAEWSLFDPGTAPGLEDVYGDAYRALYARYEAEGLAVATVPAQDVWFAILRLQIETGVPYMVYKDAANAKSNQQNLGTIKCSNLCSEIIQYTAEDEIAVCNLGSLSLPAFVRDGKYDYDALHAATKILARNLDRVIDVTFYPLPEASGSNLRHRPIGLGVQGLADVFFKLKMPYDSPRAAEVNRRIFATIYHAAVKTSCDLAVEKGPYETFQGSPASLGKLQFDLWDAEPHPMYDWDALKTAVQEVGMRNSLLLAPMPTASTAQILGNTEAFEPVTSNLYSRNTLAGTFAVVNKYLLNDLLDRGLWSPELKQKLVASEGSVQSLDIPQELKDIYKTAYEMSMKTLVDMAADRGIYVDQSMSLNMFVAAPTFRKLSSMHFYAWRKGLKTGMYYLRSKAASSATKITLDSSTSPVECLACSG